MATAWRLAKSLETLRSQVNAVYPKRSKISDGAIGDAAHAQTASDHNVNPNGVVCAIDLTHDPKNGFDAHKLADHLRRNRHPNLRYVISRARIAGYWTNWEWHPSVGHHQHAHISVGNHHVPDGQTTSNYDSTKPWDINGKEKIIMQKTALKRLVKAMLNRDVSKEDNDKYLGRDPNAVIMDIDNWAIKNGRTYSQTLSRLNKQLNDVKKALANERSKTPKEVIKEVEKIVEKPVYIDRPVGEEEAVRGFFGKLLDLVFKR